MLLAALILFFFPSVAGTAQDRPFQVLVLNSYRNSLMVNEDWLDGIVRGFSTASDLAIEIDIESPNLTRFGDAEYLRDLLNIYRRKYRDPIPDLVIPTYTPALQFMLEHGQDLFPGVPIVFCGADNRLVTSRGLPPHVTGVTAHEDFAGTLELALNLQPASKRVALIVGSGAIDKQFEQDARLAIQPFQGRAEFTWLRAMPLAELTAAVDQLPADTVLMYLLQLEDRNGNAHVPIATVEAISASAHGPVYGVWDSLLGHGIIGGRLAAISDDGFKAAQMGIRVLRGEPPGTISVVHRPRNDAIFHGGELARWNIDEKLLPAGSRVLYRQESRWEAYRTEFIIAALIIAVQGFLIVMMLLNRAKLVRSRLAFQGEHELRLHSELLAGTLESRLARFSKQRSLGVITTGIAHEVNQPLIAIQNYAQAANRRLKGGGGRGHKPEELLRKIEQQAERAGDIIRHIRNLVSTDDPELDPVSLDMLIGQVIKMMTAEIENRACSIDCRMGADVPSVLADELEIQLVMVNLLQNAMQSMASLEEGADKVVVIEVTRTDDQKVQVSVSDRGPGIDPDMTENVFEALYTEKQGGMGMGLAICRTVIESHGGRIWCESDPSRGAIFRFTLRLA